MSTADRATTNWDPAQYLRFEGERLRPAVDLMQRIDHPAARRVVDLGCGAGNALPLLAARFPGATILGVDGAPAMLEKARATGFAVQRADIAEWTPDAPPDVIFSNAALHWLPDHAAGLPRLLGLLAPGGVLAVQVPDMERAPFRALQAQVAAHGPWAAALAGIDGARGAAPPERYYDLLAPVADRPDLWVTEYLHVLRGPDPVVQWAMGTSLRPYLDRLDDTLRAGFLAAYAEAVRPHYRPRADGAVLLPFRRQFLVARRR
ncbi:methyltransferase domain-containing protein [Roseomonas sp. NAR14]|uniref:Methyltransferase domain-containing protein n=1 Tax=Roseomonas acroporae TaxID=2937791 RepID=A0A9X2BX71_9PROT|nr:methyltransferase domain-containing protein [Roseomonas acroporae]MCK8784680.1 methyltransferase domain-containing protein [Roseomonas acroporae]